MTNQIAPQIFIFIALDCEAKPLLRFYDFKKEHVNHAFSIYKNHNCVLTVTGVGKVAMAGAVAYTLALFPRMHYPIILNLGIAGHKTEDLGRLFITSKIVDNESGKKFYPQMIGGQWPECSEIITSSVPCEDYSQHCLYDMEAAAFYETAVRFSSSELIHCLKIVSDNEHSAIDKIQPKSVTEWVDSQMTEIERLIGQLVNLRESIAGIELKEYNEIIKKWHFTVTGKIKLKALLKRWQVLTVGNWPGHDEICFNSGKELLRRLESDVDAVAVHL
ncbi:MAG: hypothetical protein L3J75_06870 [Methylococcaceae bacterium]|nr:hypothetical protein [Methylococcaceae bacterium]